MATIHKESEIKIRIGLDESHNPQKITWIASDMDVPSEREVKSFMLGLWDKKENNSMRIELWNSEMQVNEMYSFIYQSVVSMSDMLNRSTNDQELSDDMKDFAAFFAKKAGLVF